MPDPRLPHVPDDWTVWAFSDAHGVTSALIAALQAAGIVDEALHWVAPPRTALVGCGDYLDRGVDVRGLVRLLRRLQADAAAAGGAVLLARGNHEAMPLMIRGRCPRVARDVARVRRAMPRWRPSAAAPGTPTSPALMVAPRGRRAGSLRLARPACPTRCAGVTCSSSTAACRPGQAPADLGVTHRRAPLDPLGLLRHALGRARASSAYRAAGIERVVFGHTPQWSGPTLYQEGHSLGIDTNAVGNPRMPAGAVQELTLLGLCRATAPSSGRAW